MLPTPLEIERAGLKAWPGIEVEWDGAWVRRASNGYTKRANSAQCFDPEDDANAGHRVAETRRWFEDRGLRAVFRVNLLTGPNLAAALDDANWDTIDHSRLMAMELPVLAADPRGEVRGVHDPEFLAAQQQLKGTSDEEMAKLRAILDVLEVPAVGIVLRADDGRAVSSALMAVADGIVITGNVVTDSRERRKGYGVAMMRTGLAWAAKEGARFAALNVAADNEAGLALYRSLGYRAQYDYAYRVPWQS
ncbi:MAG TPA: GNAT family N-acetyltransferase [Devosia sp.]|nr:GNAT family N-acetyltransferase [Devosia sp.]